VDNVKYKRKAIYQRVQDILINLPSDLKKISFN